MKATITIITPENPEHFNLNLSHYEDFEVRCKGHETEVKDRIRDIKDFLPMVLWYNRPVYLTIESKMNNHD